MIGFCLKYACKIFIKFSNILYIYILYVIYSCYLNFGASVDNSTARFARTAMSRRLSGASSPR